MPRSSPGLGVACRDVAKTYVTASERVEALRGVDAEFPAGAVSAVVGASGSGKSTLLRLLAGLDLPSAGSVRVGKRDLALLPRRSVRDVRRTHVGYVFQRPSDNFVSYLTLAEHVELGAGGHEGLEFLAEVGLGDRLGHLPGELSSGEQQRAAFALAAARNVGLVVADEPTAELDAESSAAVLALVRRLSGLGLTLVLATHDAEVRATAEHIVELEHGHVRGEWSASRPLSLSPAGDPAGEPRPVVLAARGVSKHYGDVTALREVTVELRAGELAALLGRSGSGKTTLLNVLAGWEKPDTGSVGSPGERLAERPWSDLAVAPQRLGLIEELTVRENVEYPLRLSGSLPDGRVDELLESLALAELGGRFPAETSVGQQQRTTLARALVVRPRVLLADEPTGHQDAGSADLVLAALARAVAEGTSALVATHDEELAAHCHRIVELQEPSVAAGRRANA